MSTRDELTKIYYRARGGPTTQQPDPILATNTPLKLDENGANVFIRRPGAHTQRFQFCCRQPASLTGVHRTRIAQSFNILKLVLALGGLIAVVRFGARAV